MKKNIKPIWVSPDFARYLKIEAAKRGTSVINLTKELTPKNEKKKDLFDFRI